jgi:hypothetical protein
MAEPPVAETPPGSPNVNKKPVATPVKPPPFVIQSHESRDRYLKLMTYGDYGVGKTYLAGTASEVESMRDVLLVNAESGDLTLDHNEHGFKDIDSVRVKDYRTVARVHEFLKLHCQFRESGEEDRLIALETQLKGIKITKPKHYYTVIIDSLTEVEAYCMNQLLGIGDTTKLDEEVASAEWAEYKRNHSMVSRLVRNFRDLPMHVLMTCSRQYTQDDQKRFNFSPQMTGKLAGQVQGFMDMVGYYVVGAASEDEKLNRRLYVQPVGRFAAKCRFSSYKGNYFDNPTIGKILQEVGLTSAE